MSRLWFSWDAQYPDEGSTCITAATQDEATSKALQFWGYSNDAELLAGEVEPEDLVSVRPLAEGDVDMLQQEIEKLSGQRAALLEALVELVETLRAEAPGSPLNNLRFDALAAKARDAIAKARGE